jgi:tetratricopeptide (TPR) repeat protein
MSIGLPLPADNAQPMFCATGYRCQSHDVEPTDIAPAQLARGLSAATWGPNVATDPLRAECVFRGRAVREPGDPSFPVYFILHVPKTAGQTIQQHLGDHCVPGTLWGPDQEPRLQALSGRRYNPGSLPDANRIRAVFGHNLGRSLEKHFPNREIRRVVLLRDPVSLQISLYNHRMMVHLTKGLGTYSFDRHLKALPRDFIAHRLLARWLEIPWPALIMMTDREKYAALHRALSGFWFVGAHTDCDRVIAAIAGDLGLPAAARRRNTAGDWQNRVAWHGLRADELSPTTCEAILVNNPLDQALWERWRAAGFSPAGIRPRLPQSTGGRRFLAHELLRPIFTGICRFQRDWAFRLRPGQIGNAAGRRILRAERAQEARRWELAAQCYRKALIAMPNVPGMWVQYGHVLKESGKVVEAEAAYRRAITLDPDHADAHLQLGHLLRIQGRTEEAAGAFLRSVVLDPAPRHARDQLIGLGWTAERIEQGLSHSASAAAGEG